MLNPPDDIEISSKKLNADNIQALKRLASYYSKEHILVTIFGMTAMILFATATLALARGIDPAFNKIILENKGQGLWLFPVFITSMFFIRGITNYASILCFAQLGHKIIQNIQEQLYQKLIKADLSYFIRYPSSQLISYFSYEIQPIRLMISGTPVKIVRDMLTFFVISANLIYTDWQLSLMIISCVPLYLLLFLSIGKRMNQTAYHLHHTISTMTHFIDESFKNIRQIKAGVKEQFQQNKAHKKFKHIYQLSKKTDLILASRLPISETIAGAFASVLMLVCSYRVLNGTSTAGEVLSFVISAVIIYKPLRSLLEISAELHRGSVALKRIFKIIDTPNTITDKPNAKKLKVTHGNIIFKNISFAYEKNLLPAINNTSFHIPGSKTIVIVGPSGVGKSTLFNLLIRFFDAHQGSILIDQQNIRDVTQESLRKNIDIVLQDFEIFNDTVSANIAYGEEKPDEEKMYHAAKMAECDSFIQKLDHKYDTVIGERGIKLSGGQRQRIILSRIFYKPAPILLFDEATSALDNITEKTVQKALDTLHTKHTILIIAHRLSTIKKADIIFMMEQGRIADSGTHRQLFQRHEEYRKLYEYEDSAKKADDAA